MRNAKNSGNKDEINNLEQEIKNLKSQQKGDYSQEKSPNISPNSSYWLVVGISIITLIALGFWMVRKHKKV